MLFSNKRHILGHRFCALILFLVLSSACRGSKTEVLPGDDFNANSLAAAAALQPWYNTNGLWNTAGWWNAANCIEAIENVIQAENGGRHLAVLDKTFRLNSARNFLNEYYDDEGWWALAWIRAFDLTGDTRYLNMAKTIFGDMTTGWDEHCDGGIWWKKDRHYKNAIANELFLLVAVRLHQRTPGDAGAGSFLDWALREWNWFGKSGMINRDNVVNDGLNRFCDNNGQTTWTYNQGVILGGLVDLYKVTGDSNYLSQATAIADAATRTLVSPEGVLREPGEPGGVGGGDVPQFKGIFIRYLADLYDVTRKPEYHDTILKSARSIWQNNRDGSDRLGLRWTGPLDTVDAARHSSAMFALTALAEPVTKDLPFAKGSGCLAFNHEVGVSAGVLGWECNASNALRSGFMQTGPFLSSLPVGRHQVHLRMTVDQLRGVDSALAWVDVRDCNTGRTVARRDIRWNAFKVANETRDFELAFTNSKSATPLEFRVFWNNISNAPALRISDVTVGEYPSWTAANLLHDIGRLDGSGGWSVDPVRDMVSGCLTKGALVRELSAGPYSAVFELKVDNFNLDKAKVATLSVADADTGEVIVSRDLLRSDFRTVLYHSFALDFTAVAGKRYDFRAFWHYSSAAPRLTQRSVILKASFGAAPGAGNVSSNQ
ncbi:MAG TPA: glycoside hydrolase family 76 protein [Candidatus Paceibacterota bacterium]|nr:glycoside hydrolase family 76 protein [Candidatus Paceibacterota bacterium]